MAGGSRPAAGWDGGISSPRSPGQKRGGRYGRGGRASSGVDGWGGIGNSPVKTPIAILQLSGAAEGDDKYGYRNEYQGQTH